MCVPGMQLPEGGARPSLEGSAAGRVVLHAGGRARPGEAGGGDELTAYGAKPGTPADGSVAVRS